MGLTRASVIADAAAVADEVGIDQLTLATVARRLGVSLPALYKHVSGLEGLHRDIAVLAVQELTDVLGFAAIGQTGPEAVEALLAAYRRYGRLHPGRAAASVRAPQPGDAEHEAAAAAAVAVISAALAGYRLGGDDLVHAVRSFRVIAHGLTALEAAGGFGLAQPVDETARRLVAGLDASLRQPGIATVR